MRDKSLVSLISDPSTMPHQKSLIGAGLDQKAHSSRLFTGSAPQAKYDFEACGVLLPHHHFDRSPQPSKLLAIKLAML